MKIIKHSLTWYSTQLWRMGRGDASRQREEPEDRWGLRPRRRRRVGEFRQVLEPELITRHGKAAPHIPEIEQQLDKPPALTFRDLTNILSLATKWVQEAGQQRFLMFCCKIYSQPFFIYSTISQLKKIGYNKRVSTILCSWDPSFSLRRAEQYTKQSVRLVSQDKLLYTGAPSENILQIKFPPPSTAYRKLLFRNYRYFDLKILKY